jgi:peroxiredoxin
VSKNGLKSLSFFILIVGLACLTVSLVVRGDEIKPVTVWQPMPDFTLPAYQGGDVTLSKLRGQNVLLIFLRGLAGKDHWCHICNYQYAELAELDMKQQIRKKYNVEIFFVLPYGKEMVAEWVDKFPDQLADIEKWKSPADPEKLDEKRKQRLAMVKKLFPKSFCYEKGKVPLPFPVLIDEEAKISKGLGLFRTEWGGSKVEQNVPTVYIICKKGMLQLKYISQNTFDRPSPEYILNVLSVLNKSE